MRKFRYILLTAALLALSCEKEQPTVDFGKLPIHRGYMQFSTDVSSRSHLAESMRGKDFGVIGVRYSETTNWDAAKSTNAPGTWFYNQQVSCSANDGTCSYDPIQKWESYNYSFFAYYPYGGTGISLSGSDATNTPMLTYTYGWSAGTDAINVTDSNSPIFDLMTAEAIDVNGSGSGTVDLDFQHRMFAFEVLVNNYNENSEGTTDARQKITNLTLTLEGLKNTSMTIPLSMLDEENDKIAYTSGDVGTPIFQLSNTTVEIPAFNETMERTFNGETETCGAGVATSISKYGSTNGGYLFLIPQEGTDDGVTGTLDWVELKYFTEDGGEVSNTFNSTIDFEPGVLYQIHINFVGNGITIALIEAGTWDSHPDVTHTFE